MGDYMSEPINREFAETAATTIREAVDIVESAFAEPANQDSPFQRDQAVIDAMNEDVREVRSRLIGTGISGSNMVFQNAIDHLRMLAVDATREPAPVWSPLTNTRVILETIVVACYMLEPGISTELRIARIAGMLIAEADKAYQADRTFTTAAEASSAAHRNETLSEMARGGIVLNGKPPKRSVRVGVERAQADLNMTYETTRLLNGSLPGEPYRLLSGASHARPWLLRRVATEENGRFTGQTATLATAVVTSLLSLEAWADCWSGYFGIEMDAASRFRALRKGFLVRNIDELTV
jgi:hypothetical protein